MLPGVPESVLKLGDHPGWIQQARQYAELTSYLRSRHYPAPLVLWHGAVGDLSYFLIMEKLPGRALDGGRFGPTTASQLSIMIPLVKRHAGLAPKWARGWSDYVCEVIYEEQHEFDALSQIRDSESRALCDAVLRRRDQLGRVQFGSADLVTGSFEPSNVFAIDHAVSGVCDLEAAGSGDLAIDLACLLVHVAGRDAEESVRDAALSINRQEPFEVAEIYWMIHEMWAAVSTGQRTRVREWSKLCTTRLERLGSA